MRIDSALETALLASSTAASISARRSGSSTRSATSPDLPCCSAQAGQRLGVEGDQGGDERAAVADDDALVDQRVRPQPVLEHGGGDVLAAGGHQDLLLAPGDPDEALVVDLADVAGVEPAVGVLRLGGRRRRCASSRRRPGRPGRAARRRRRPARWCRAAGARRVPTFWASGRLTVSGRGGLGEAVALEHVDADAAVEVAEPLAERRAAGDGVRAAAAERRAQPGVDQPVEDPVLGPHARGRTGRVSRPRDQAMAIVGGPVEDLAAAVGDGALGGGVEDLLEDPRHREDEGRAGTRARSSSRCLMSAEWPSRTRALTQPTWMIRAKTWASGRNSSVRGPSSSATGEELVELVDRVGQLEHEVAVGEQQPLGRPVVPEV